MRLWLLKISASMSITAFDMHRIAGAVVADIKAMGKVQELRVPLLSSMHETCF